MMTDADLNHNYEGVFDGRLISGEKPALLLVDMVQAYLQVSSPLYCKTAQSAVGRAAELLSAARQAGLPIAHSCVSYTPGGANGGLFYRKVPSLKVFDEGSPLGAFAEPLIPLEGELIITKQYPSAFFATDLAEQLHSAGADTLIIAGFSTSGCVRASALDAMQNEFAPFVVRDACADRHAKVHEANLFDLGAKYAEICDQSDAIEMIALAASAAAPDRA